jgi:hypothetical protein
MKKQTKVGDIAPTQDEPLKDYVPQTNEEYNKDLKEKLEEQKNAKIITAEQLKAEYSDFYHWLKSITRYGNIDRTMIIYQDNKTDIRSNSKRVWVNFWTSEHCYHISAVLPYGDYKGYLGCIASTRKERVGEDWNRGSDLPDGKYEKKTFDDIVKSIVSYEMKNLQLWR